MFENITDAEAALAVATSQLKEDFLVKALKCATILVTMFKLFKMLGPY